MHRLKGIIFVVISAIAFGCMPLLCSQPIQEGLDGYGLALWRFGTAIPTVFLIILLRRNQGEQITVPHAQWGPLLLLGTIGYGLTGLLLVSSYQYISTGMATVLHFTYPLFVLIGGILFCHQTYRSVLGKAVALCMIGMSLIVDWTSDGDMLWYGIVVFTGITYAFYLLYANVLKRVLPPWTITWYMSIISFVMVAIAYVYEHGFHMVHLSYISIISLILLGQVASVLAVGMVQLGLRYVDPSSAAIISLLEPVAALTIGVTVLGETVTAPMLAGCGLIGGAVYYVVKK